MCEKSNYGLVVLCMVIGFVGCRQLTPLAQPPTVEKLSSRNDDIQQIELPKTTAKSAPYARAIETEAASNAPYDASKIAAIHQTPNKSAPKPDPATASLDQTVTPATNRIDIGTPPPIVIAKAHNASRPSPATPARPKQPKPWHSLTDDSPIPEERSLAEEFAAENKAGQIEELEVTTKSTAIRLTNASEPSHEVTKLPPIVETGQPGADVTDLAARTHESAGTSSTENPSATMQEHSAIRNQAELRQQAVIGFADDPKPAAPLQQPKSFQEKAPGNPPKMGRSLGNGKASITLKPPAASSEKRSAISQVYRDLKSSDPGRQLRACRFLQEHASPSHIEALTPLLGNDSVEVCLAATVALGKCGPWPRPEPLQEVLLNGNLPRQVAAAIALCELGSPVGPAAIEQMSHNLNPEIRAAAASAAGVLADPLFTPMLIRLIDDPTVARRAALSALPRCVGEQVAESGDNTNQAADRWRAWYESGGRTNTANDR